MHFEYWDKLRKAFAVGKLNKTFTVPAFSGVNFGDYRKGSLQVTNATGLAGTFNSFDTTFRALTKFTFSAWIKPQGSTLTTISNVDIPSYYQILSRVTYDGSVVPTPSVLFGVTNDNKVYLWISTSGTTLKKFTSVGKVTLFEWNHVGCSVDITAGKISIWINGVEEQFTQAFSGTLLANTTRKWFCGHDDLQTFLSERSFLLDELCVFNTVKTHEYFATFLRSQLQDITAANGVDDNLIAYWRFTNTLTDAQNTVGTWGDGGGGVTPATTIDTDGYPFDCGYSWMFGIVDLRSIGKNFSLRLAKEQYKDFKFSIAVCWQAEDGSVIRKFFYKTTKFEEPQFETSMYKGEKVLYTNAWLEFWADQYETTASMANDLVFETSILEHAKSFKDEAPTSFGSLSLNTSIYCVFPGTIGSLTFSSPFPTLNY